MLKRLLSSAAGFIFIAGAAQAATIDFETFAEGEIVTAGALPGVSALTVDTPGGNDFLIVYDSSSPVGADPDLEQPFTNAESEATLSGGGGMFSFLDDAVLAEFNPGKIGIFANDNSDCSSGTSCTPPDDAPNGGMVTFELDRIMFFNSIDLFDIESGGAEITLTLSDMVTEVVFTVGGFDTNGPTGNKGVRVLADAAIAISKIKINFMGISGAFENINLSEVPVPGALPLLLSGIAGLGFASRRRKKA